ncbi:dethiobiotin synthase [Sapientia aquatica]|uniref:ATP-dependent dethiobiotin synthetase BioD n=1 Tax=Sapientia aquatica TaxID=1549640 RepID=A0A4R5VSU2_9BURK|nr:dethiobiotin synthase [Sapientia aquatica]TDK61926.1 dethiobiotin synthase [Sapientia aquatica]
MSQTKKAFFVAGTDTEIGKTLVSSALVHSFAQQGLIAVGMKPVAAGALLDDGMWVNEDVMSLKASSNLAASSERDRLINPYLFKLPAAPHIAAQQEGRQIALSVIVDCYQQLASQVEAIIVEGVGGFNVPFNATEDSAQMAQRLNLPVILVVGMRLGCINHALLTAEAIAARGLNLAGWVANSAQHEMAYLQENLSALQERIKAPLLGCIPNLAQPSAAAAAHYLDVNKILVD